MKKTLYTPLLTAALLLAASCANDPVEEILNPSAPGTHLPGDTFIIDYAASTGEADTRGLSAAERIQSLDYLVYQSTDGGTTYTLLKRRAIPDINTNTTWPLTRETMTWAQREALKDTLNTSCMYKMVFVANAADWIWDNTETDHLKGSSTIVLQHANLPTDGTEAPTFDEGRLILPPRVFSEKDMYYMETVEVDGKSYTGEKTAHQNVLLERMINKVEVKLNTDINNGGINYDDLTSYLKTEIETDYTQLSTEQGKLYSAITKTLTDLANGLNVDLHIRYENAKDKVAELIKGTDMINDLLTNDLKEKEAKFKENLFTLYYTLCHWEDVKHVKILYQDNAYAQAINFTKESIPSSNNQDKVSYTLTNNAFVYYTFGNNIAGELNTLNKVNVYQFIQEGKDTPLFTISGKDLPLNEGIYEDKKGGNNSYCFICNPIGTTRHYNATETYQVPEFNMITKFGDKWDKEYVGFTDLVEIRTLDELESILNENSGYKDASKHNYVYQNSKLEQMYIQIDWPVATPIAVWSTPQEIP